MREDAAQRNSGSARVPRVGDGVLAIADFPCARRELEREHSFLESYASRVRFGVTPKPARGTRALPGVVITLILILVSWFTTSCRKGMVDQQKIKPLAEDSFFADDRGSRRPPAHTVARGELREDEQFYTGKIGNDLAATFPKPITREMLFRGHERFDTYCAACHGLTGDGNGMIVQRGFPQPPSFHEQRLRAAPPGHFIDVIINGYGVMYSYASRVAPEDRWAIAAYIRALQLSQHATAADADPKVWDVKGEK